MPDGATTTANVTLSDPVPIDITTTSTSTIFPQPSTTKAQRKAHPTFHFLAGLGSGISSAILLQPADLLKTRVQQSGNAGLTNTLRSILAGPNPVAQLWRGTVPSALRTGFGSALYFTTLSSMRSVAANMNGTTNKSSTTSLSNTTANPNTRRSTVLPTLPATQNLLIGASARVLAGFILMPMTVIKVRYESSLYTYRSLPSAISSIYSVEGIRGFFTGFGATAIRDAPYAGVYVVFYEGLKSWFDSHNPSPHSNPNPNPNPDSAAISESTLPTNSSNSNSNKGVVLSGTSINALSGVLAAAAATALTNPFDAVKTRLQLMPGRYGNSLRAARMMVREDGVKAFFDGLALRMARKAASSALAWTVYEELIGRAERRFT